MILGTGLSDFLLLTFVYVLEHVQNCLNIAQTARLRSIDIKEAGRRECLAGHLCLPPAVVIGVVHVSVQWPWGVRQAAGQKHSGKRLIPVSTVFFSFVRYSNNANKGVYVGDALLPLDLGVQKASHGVLWKARRFKMEDQKASAI